MESINAGILAAEEIRDHHPTVKIIFLTAHETDDMIITTIATGAVDYVVKECDEETLLKHIRYAYADTPLLHSKFQQKYYRNSLDCVLQREVYFTLSIILQN